MTLPSRHWHRSRISPAGDCRTSSVTGAAIGTMPVSSSTVAAQMVLLPDIAGYSADPAIT